MDTVPARAPILAAVERPARASALGSALSAATAGASVAAVAAALVIAGGDVTGTFIVTSCLVLAWTFAGAVIAKHQHCPAASIVQTFGAVTASGVLGWSLDTHRNVEGVGGFATDALVRLALTSAAAVVFHLLLTLPDGYVRRPRHRRLVWAGYMVAGTAGLSLFADRSEVVRWPVALLWVAAFSAVPIAHANYRSSSAADQRRLQWIGWAAVVAAEIALVCGALTLIADWPHHVSEIALAATGLVPLAMAAATAQRMLARVDRLLTHTVSLTGLTALIVVAYLLALAAFGRRPNESERTLLLLSMLAAAGASIGYQPTRAWLTERANRAVYGERVSPDEALRTWGSRLTRAIPLDELLLQLAETLKKSMQLRSAQIWTGADGHYEVSAMVPHRALAPYLVDTKERSVVSRAGVSGGTWLDIWLPGLVDPGQASSTRVAPIAHGGELLGIVVCERAPDAEAFTEDDDRVLTELARQVALALHNVQLDTALQASLDELRQTNDELRASRSRIVAAGDSERRKLERNLHDGAQQHLVSLAVKLRLAKDSVVDDPDDAVAMIDEIRGDLQEAIAELRSLAHGIFPPLLMSGGLAEALPSAAARAALPTSTDIDVGRHDQEIETAIYFCCMEALQNAGKYATSETGGSALVKVTQDEQAIHWEVTDDGPGFDAGSSAAGHGFVNMRDRMGAFGGTLEVISTIGQGTTVRGMVPLP